MSSGTYSQPGRICDVVMKGGITSGVVYPLAVCELAKVYSFKNIGGTSAGAIAAAATAAAERGRRNGSGGAAGFVGLSSLPEWIGGPGRLKEMFRPDPSTQALFAIVVGTMSAETMWGKVWSLGTQLLRRFPLLVVAAVALVFAVNRFLLADLSGPAFIYAMAVTVGLAACLFLAAVAVRLYRQVTQTIPANFYGLSRAFDPKVDIAGADAPLTNWLTRYLNELAGKPLKAGPLTFGDLYAAQPAPGDPESPGPQYRGINLEMMTTAISHGRPYRLPFRDPDRIFFFSDEELRKLFPDAVVDHMVRHASTRDGMIPQGPGGARLYAFPEAEDLPVIVATRMSLSFPILLSAVPLYAVDFTRKANQQENTPPTAERCWFSDGGICSNLPIHFFDAPLPMWPTFGINLKQFHPDHPDEADAVWLPSNSNSGWLPAWNRFELAGAGGGLPGFLGAIFNSMQNWRDNTQARVPGYRDRLVHISQRDNEGGLNLNMPPATIKLLSERGRRAGAALVERFGAGTASPSWTEHRWVRFRSSMELTVGWIRQLMSRYGTTAAPDPTLETILLRGPKDPPASYRLGPGDQQRAKGVMDSLTQVSAGWGSNGSGLVDGAPRPTPELRIRPRV